MHNNIKGTPPANQHKTLIQSGVQEKIKYFGNNNANCEAKTTTTNLECKREDKKLAVNETGSVFKENTSTPKMEQHQANQHETPIQFSVQEKIKYFGNNNTNCEAKTTTTNLDRKRGDKKAAVNETRSAFKQNTSIPKTVQPPTNQHKTPNKPDVKKPSKNNNAQDADKTTTTNLECKVEDEILTAKGIRNSFKGTNGIIESNKWDQMKEEALKKLGDLKIKDDQKYKFYIFVLEITKALQNDFAETVHPDKLSMSSQSRLNKHDGFRYVISIGNIKTILSKLFNVLVSYEHVVSIAQICTHKNESTSHSTPTKSLINLLSNLGIPKNKEELTRDLEDTHDALGTGLSAFFENENNNWSIYVPRSHAKSEYYCKIYQISSIKKYIKFYNKILSFNNDEHANLVYSESLKKLKDCESILKEAIRIQRDIKKYEGVVTIDRLEPKIDGYPISKLLDDIVIKNRAVKKENILNISYIEAQRDILNKHISNKVELKFVCGATYKSQIKLATLDGKPQEIEPSIVRDCIKLLGDSGDELHKKRPINLFEHTTELTLHFKAKDDEKLEDSKMAINIIRAGALEFVDAAIVYLKIMFEIGKTALKEDDNIVYIVDNRILLHIDPLGIFHEARLLKKHRELMDEALKSLKDEKYFGDTEVRLIHLNLQDKKTSLAYPDKVTKGSLDILRSIFNNKIGSKYNNYVDFFHRLFENNCISLDLI